MRFTLRIFFRGIISLVVFACTAFLLNSVCAQDIPDESFAGHTGPVKLIACRHLFDLNGFEGKKFNQQSAVAFFKDRIFVLDGVNSRVCVFNRNGDPLFQFGQRGSDPGEFKLPLGLTVDYQGRIYVADSANHRIQIFDPMGKILSYFTLKEDRYGTPADPTDLVVDEKNNRLLIVDNDNHRLILYSLDGKFIKEIGEVGFENGQFRYPYSIDLDKKGNFYVVDVLNTRVQAFNSQGEFVRNIGEWGIEKGQLFRPQGVAVDEQGRVYVTENYIKIGVIQVFSEDGTFLALLGDESRKKLRFAVPTDLCFDDQGRIYICEMNASRVSVYKVPE